jgi:hypothetical protein
MDILNQTSLAKTVDNLNEAHFWGTHIPAKDALASARWIASRQGLPGSYYGLFAPTAEDISQPLYLFCGELITSRASRRHILGEEASRNLLQLRIPIEEIQEAWKRANREILEKIHLYETAEHPAGWYCCGNCTIAFWRNLIAGGLDQQEKRLKAGLKALKQKRNGEGEWRTFPFYQTLLTLLEIDLKPALEEMRYAVPSLEKKMPRLKRDNKFNLRRKAVVERVLAKV